MTAPSSNAILVATVGRPHGVRGLVRLHAATEEAMTIEALGTLHDAQGRGWTIQWRGEGIAALSDAAGSQIASREDAARLTNLQLFVARERLPEAQGDEFYHVDLIGLVAVTPEGEVLGTVSTVHDYGAGVSLEIAGPRELIVPFTKLCVPEVDLAAGRLVVVPPDEIEVEGDPSGPEDVAVRAGARQAGGVRA